MKDDIGCFIFLIFIGVMFSIASVLIVGGIAVGSAAPSETVYFCNEISGVVFEHAEYQFVIKFVDDDFHIMSDNEFNQICKENVDNG